MQALILDDDVATSRLVGRIAEAAGFDPVLVLTGADFRERYRSNLPDIIVLDLKIGDTDGIEELRFLSNKAYPNALILASGFDHRVLSTAEAMARSLGLKIVATLPKPFRAPALQHLFDVVKEQAASPVADELLTAIAKNQLVLEYQPIVLRRDSAIRRFEALVRWNHPKSGRLLPARFIPTAESAPKVMAALTDWVIAAAIRQYADLREQGLVTPLAVNVSGRILHDVDFPNRLHGRLQEAGIPAGHFCLEITESAVARDPVRTMEVYSRLRLKGIDLAVDDFGTGHWSLSRFQQLPFSIIKIADTFIRDIKKSPAALKTVQACLDLAANWDLETIAEGVESEDVASRLATLGVSGMQGYLIAPPMPSNQVADWLRPWAKRAEEAQKADAVP